jgi:Uncharacterized phage-associated protein
MTDTPQNDITDVANWFLSKEPMSHKKLQKICYYAVAWGHALLGRSICRRDDFEAWVHGPVNPDLYKIFRHYGWTHIHLVGAAPTFNPEDKEFLESVWNTYGEFDGHQLEALTHEEAPWINARRNLPLMEPSNNLISVDDMVEYYNSVFDDGQND